MTVILTRDQKAALERGERVTRNLGGDDAFRRMTVSFDTRAVDAQARTFAGYASVFGYPIPDYQEKVDPGAFSSSLAAEASAPRVKVLWQHSWDWPIGLPTTMREDDYGLYVEAQLADTWTVQNEYMPLLAAGVVDRMSIGFRILNDYYDDADGFWHLAEVELWEFSPVTFAANEAAKITKVAGSVGDVKRNALRAMGVEAGAELDAEAAQYAMAVLMGAPGAGGFRDLPDSERRSLYEELAGAYRRCGLEAPEYAGAPVYAQIDFRHDERKLFAGRFLRKRISDVTSASRHFARLGGALPAAADAELHDALDALASCGAGDVTSQLDSLRRRRRAEAALGITLT
mgnify:CR=1 FL=1